MSDLSPQYQSIINSLNYINKGDARELSIVWVLPLSARIVNNESTIHRISVDTSKEDLDWAVADYLSNYAECLARIRFHQAFNYGSYIH